MIENYAGVSTLQTITYNLFAAPVTTRPRSTGLPSKQSGGKNLESGLQGFQDLLCGSGIVSLTSCLSYRPNPALLIGELRDPSSHPRTLRPWHPVSPPSWVPGDKRVCCVLLLSTSV